MMNPFNGFDPSLWLAKKGVELAIVVITALFLLGGGTWLGYRWADGNQQEQVQRLSDERDAAIKQVNKAELRESEATRNLLSLRATLKTERARLDALTQRTQAALAGHAQAMRQLSDKQHQRTTQLHKRAKADEDCATLRDLAVCRGLADGLFQHATGQDKPAH